MSLHQAYPVEYTAPIRKQLQEHKVQELLTPEDVLEVLKQERVLVLINSVCGCSATNARPALYAFMKEQPEVPVATVFAGVHHEATAELRKHIDQAPSSPSFAFFEKGKCTFFLARESIQGVDVQDILQNLLAVKSE